MKLDIELYNQIMCHAQNTDIIVIIKNLNYSVIKY